MCGISWVLLYTITLQTKSLNISFKCADAVQTRFCTRIFLLMAHHLQYRESAESSPRFARLRSWALQVTHRIMSTFNSYRGPETRQRAARSRHPLDSKGWPKVLYAEDLASTISNHTTYHSTSTSYPRPKSTPRGSITGVSSVNTNLGKSILICPQHPKYA